MDNRKHPDPNMSQGTGSNSARRWRIVGRWTVALFTFGFVVFLEYWFVMRNATDSPPPHDRISVPSEEFVKNGMDGEPEEIPDDVLEASRRAEMLLEIARVAREREKLDEALMIAEQGLALVPDAEELLLLRARIREQLEEKQARVDNEPSEIAQLSAIDRTLREMTYGNIAFNAPSPMNLQDTEVIQLALSARETIDELKSEIIEKGEKIGAKVRISDRMEARLTGQNFQLTAISPELQAVSSA
ncbi:MAG: hypothetical protein U9Q81_06800 [Pseudomonadota bacterium]|nr:hypothetical protein [Pseudomonadota bacterium]